MRAEMAGLDEPLKSLKVMRALVNDPSYEVRVRMAARMVDGMCEGTVRSVPEGYAKYLELLRDCPYDDDFRADVMMEAMS